MYLAPAVGEAELLTYLTDAAMLVPGQAGPRVGDLLELRVRHGGREVEAWSATGVRLGRLPPAEREALDDLLTNDALRLQGRISAVVPRRFGDGRIHIRVQTPAR